VPVRIFGTDSSGRTFSDKLSTVDVSQGGAKLSGVGVQLKVDEIVGVAYGSNKVHFKVKWACAPGTPSEGRIGHLNLSPEKPLWDFPLPPDAMDNFRFTSTNDRRQSDRVKCSISVQLNSADQAPIWGRASDLSLGGCFVEMLVPPAMDAKFTIAIWLGDTKLRLQGEVVSAAPGFGIGVRFLDVSPGNQDFLRRHIHTIGSCGGCGLIYAVRAGSRAGPLAASTIPASVLSDQGAPP
jgi:PilZ domain